MVSCIFMTIIDGYVENISFSYQSLHLNLKREIKMTEYAASHLIVALKEEEYKISDFGKSTFLDTYDRFTVDIPYANSYIKARIMLNATDPLLPPDLIILYPILDVQLDYITLFRDWNPSDKKAFIKVFDRVKSKFTDFYLEIFSFLQTPSMTSVYKSCQQLSKDKPVELLLSYDDQQINDIIFSIPVPVTLAHEFCTRPVLCNIGIRTNYDKFSVEISCPNWASHLHGLSVGRLSQTNQFPISKFEDVMRQIYSYVIKEINSVYNSKDQRAIFFSELYKIGLGVPLEVDTVDFLRASFHVETLGVSEVEVINIVVILEKDFPKSSPIYKLRSMKGIRFEELREKKYLKVRGWDQDLEIIPLAEHFKKIVNDEMKSFFTWIKS